MKKKSLKRVAMMCSALAVLSLTACGSKPSSQLVGTWVADDNDVVEFQEDGSCTAPFTYNASWWESADHYVVKDDGTLVLSSREGHANHSYEPAESEEEALDSRSTYFVTKDTLVINGDEYTKAK